MPSALKESTMKNLSLVAAALLLPVTLAGCAQESQQASSAADRPVPKFSETVSSDTIRLPEVPEAMGEGREPQKFNTLAEMVAGADVIVIGRIVDVVPGRSVEGFTYRVNQVEVDTVLKGETTASTLLVEEVGWLGDKSWSFNDATWGAVGDVALMAVNKKDGESWMGRDVYGLASTQTRFFFLPDGTVESNRLSDDIHDPFITDQVAKGRDQLIGEVRAAVGR